MSTSFSNEVILSYTGEPFGGGCFERVGFINTRGGLDGDFIWNTGEEKWGTCDYTWNSRIVFNSRDVFGIYSDSSQIFYRAGDLRSHRPIWQTDPTYIDDGRDVDIAFNEGQLVEMNDKPGGIIDSRPAKVPGSGNPTIWGKSVHLPTNGVRGHATLNDSFHTASVVAIYYKAPFGLYTMTGRYYMEGFPRIHRLLGGSARKRKFFLELSITATWPTQARQLSRCMNFRAVFTMQRPQCRLLIPLHKTQPPLCKTSLCRQMGNEP